MDWATARTYKSPLLKQKKYHQQKKIFRKKFYCTKGCNNNNKLMNKKINIEIHNAVKKN